MKRHLLKVVFIICSVFLLSACSLEDLLEEAFELIQSEENNNVNEEINEDNNNNEKNNEQENANTNNNEMNEENHENEENGENGNGETNSHPIEDDSLLPFEERLMEQGYEILYLPNGFPYEVPYHWLYVQHPSDDKDEDGFLGTFCFDIPQRIEDIAHHFNYMPDIWHDHYGEDEEIMHQTSFTLDFTGEPMNSYIDFYLDDYGNTCADAYVDASLGGSLREGTGEIVYNPDSSRSTPGDYEQVLEHVQSGGELEALTVDYEDINSVRDRIYERDLEIFHLKNGHPVIFPYEWYAVSKLGSDGEFIAEFCTDTTIHDAIVKHHDMLNNMNADIEYFTIESSPKPNVASESGFAFNDEHGTGSWSGVTMFYVNPDPNSDFPNHNCIRAEMEFSTELID